MKNALLGLSAICLIALMLLADDHYDAIRHEFYQVWDTIEEMRGDE